MTPPPRRPTYLLTRGDDKMPDKTQACPPAVPASLGGKSLAVAPLPVPTDAAYPDRRSFVVAETWAAARQAMTTADAAFTAARSAVARAAAIAGFGTSPTGAMTVRPGRFACAAECGLVTARSRCGRGSGGLRQPRSDVAGRARRGRGSPGDRRGQMARRVGRRCAATPRRRQGSAGPARRRIRGRGLTEERRPGHARHGRDRCANGSGESRRGGVGAAHVTVHAPPRDRLSGGQYRSTVSTGQLDHGPLEPVGGSRCGQSHLGSAFWLQGLVPTTFDFGLNGQPPDPSRSCSTGSPPSSWTVAGA